MPKAVDLHLHFFRGSDVFDFISAAGAATRRQVQAALFGDGEAAGWRARVLLKRLYDAGVLRRGRCDVAGDYVYWAGEKPGDINHTVMVNWVYLHLNKSGLLDEFRREVDCGHLVADAFFVLASRPFYLEFQRTVNKRPFDKVEKYAAYCESCSWDAPGWPAPGKFARVLLVTDTHIEKARLTRIIERQPTGGVSWVLLTLKELQGIAPGYLLGQQETERKVLKWVL